MIPCGTTFPKQLFMLSLDLSEISRLHVKLGTFKRKIDDSDKDVVLHKQAIPVISSCRV